MIRPNTVDLIAGHFFDERGELRRKSDYNYRGRNRDDTAIPKEFNNLYSKSKGYMNGGIGVFRSQLSLYTNKQISLDSFSRMSIVPLPNSRNLLEQTRPELGIWGGANWLRQIIVTRNSMFVNLDLGFQIFVTKSNFKTDIAKDCIQDYFDKLIKDQHLTYKCSQLQLMADIHGWAFMLYNPWTEDFEVCAPWHVGVSPAEFLADDYRNALIVKPEFPLSQIGRYLTDEEIPENSPLYKKLQEIDNNDSCRLELLFSNFERKKLVIVDGQCYSITDHPLPRAPVLRLTCGYPVEGHINSVVDELAPLQNDYNQCAKKKSNQLKLYGGPMLIASKNVAPELNNINNEEMKVLVLNGVDFMPSEHLETINPTPLDAEIRVEMNSIKADMFEVGGLAQIDGDLDRYRQIGAIIAIQQIHESSFQFMFTILNTFLQKLVELYTLTQSHNRPDERLVESSERYPVTWADVAELMDNINLTFTPVHKNTPDGSVNEDSAGVNEIELARNACWRFISEAVIAREVPDKTPYFLDRNLLKMLTMTRLISGYQSDDEPEILERMEGILQMLFNEELERGELEPYFEGLDIQNKTNEMEGNYGGIYA